MPKTSRFHRQARGLLLLGICLLVMSLFPAQPASAVLILQPVDNSLPDFTRGTFQRSSLSALKTTAQVDSSDVAGAVQLVPIGILKDWFRSAFDLPKALTDIGAAAIGNHIFVIGGISSSAAVADVWSATIDPTTGAPDQWFDETQDLPAVQGSDQFINAVAARAVPAVTAVATGPDSGYIYVLGGSIKPVGAQFPVSSYAVSIATVTGGHITSWVSSNTQPGLRIPLDGAFRNGRQSASTVNFTIGGKTYVYLIGGLQRFKNGAIAEEDGANTVFYAQVGANGLLVKPSSPGTVGWDTLAPIPLPIGLSSPLAGFWDGSAVVDHFDVGGGVGGDALYYIGGQLRSSVGTGASSVFNNAVYRALISSNGTLTWSVAPAFQGTLPTARVGMAAVEFTGNLYVTGGRPVSGGAPVEADASVLTTYVEDDLKLAQIDNSGTTSSNFRYNTSALTVPRTRHGSVVVKATPTPQAPNAAFVYVIAGQGSSTDTDPTDDNGSKTLIYGKIGSSEDIQANGFAATGWYYAAPHDLNSTTAQVQEVDWTAVITHPNDIQVQFRTTTNGDCTSPTAFDTSQGGTAWSSALDGDTATAFFSKSGVNKVGNLTLQPSHCFQYRAKLLNAQAGLPTTPSLLNVRILVQIPGFPDLKVKTLQDARNIAGKFTGMNVELLNHSDIPSEPTQPANIEGSGSFFVDLFIFGPGQTAVTPTLPLELNPSNPKSAACVNINKNDMGVDSKITILQWYDPADATCGSTRKALQPSFTTPGHYIVIVAVDTACPEHSYGCVNEGTSGGEGNNLKRKEFDILAGQVGYPDTLLPIVRK